MSNERHRLIQTAGLSETELAYIGAVVVLASHVEYHAERAIWALTAQPVRGERPWTDGKPISDLIAKLEALAGGSLKSDLSKLVSRWCRAARPCFSCRHSVMHGQTAWLPGEWAIFNRNAIPNGARRRKDPSEFHASEHTLNLLETAFEHLLNGIHLIEMAASTPVPIGDISVPLRHLDEARLIGVELDDLAGAVRHEKY